MTSLPPEGDYFTDSMPMPSPLGLDVLPPELEGIQRDLRADAAQWEHGVPPAARFNQRLRAVLPLEGPTGATDPASHETRIRTAGEALNAPRRMPAHRRPTPLSTALALVATVAVVALLAAVVATLRPRGAATRTTTTLAGTPTATLPAPGPIKTLPRRATYAGQPGIPVVAANNPNVIYEYSDATGTAVLRRSDDGGASWHALAYPSAPGTFMSNLLLAVNPADAANVFLQVALGYHPGQAGACRQANPNDKSIVCIGEYGSSDYGAHWTLMRYPLPGTLFPNGMSSFYFGWLVQAQGDRVYAALQYNNTEVQPATEIRILSSTDHGTAWHVADAALVQQGLHICDFVAAPVGDTLFARTADVCQGDGFTSWQLWRSDDAGAHWRQVTPFAAPFNSIWNTFTVASATGSGSNQVILYEGVPNQQTGATTYYASLDGGVSWQPAPSAGLPQGAQAILLAPGQALRDGSLVVAFETGGGPSNGGPAPEGGGPTPTPSPTADAQTSGATITCYAWKAGSARWVPLTEPVPADGLSLANLYVADGAQRAVVLSLGDNTMPGGTYTIVRFG